MHLTSIPLLFQLTEVTFGDIVVAPARTSVSDSKKSELRAELEKNVYDFGIMLLEIISGKLPQSEEQGNLVNWVRFKEISFGIWK